MGQFVPLETVSGEFDKVLANVRTKVWVISDTMLAQFIYKHLGQFDTVWLSSYKGLGQFAEFWLSWYKGLGQLTQFWPISSYKGSGQFDTVLAHWVSLAQFGLNLT